MNRRTAIDSWPYGPAPWVLSGLLLVATGVATITALVTPELVHGPAVMVGSMRGTALAVLLLAMPILVLAMAAARGEGDAVAIIPNVTLRVLWAQRVNFILVVERVG